MFRTRIGHAHLFVRDLDQSVAFYRRYLNLTVNEEIPGQTAFLSGGDAHHELALTVLDAPASASPEKQTGLFHLAFDVENKAAFAEAYERLRDDGIELSPVDHVIGWGLYFPDPDGNLLELYCDTRAAPDGRAYWQGKNRPLTHATIMAARQ
jgi:catechol 2,3-dioxygenase